MKVLWLVGFALPRVAAALKTSSSQVGGGWLTGISNELLKDSETTLYICSPSNNAGHQIQKCEDNLYACFFHEKNGLKYDESLSGEFESILNEIKPDVIHCFGTEYPRTYSMTEAAKKVGAPLLISITGMVGPYSEKYYGKVPHKYLRRNPIRGIYNSIRHIDSLRSGKKDFEYRSIYEKAALLNCSHVIGRTEWDKACVAQINKEAHYYKCNETLRDSFYEQKWSYENCERHSISVPQMGYPIKGFEVFLEGLAVIKRSYSDVKVYVPGYNSFCIKNERKRKLAVWLSDYCSYVNHLIKKYDLWSNIIFCGSLDEIQMWDVMIKSNVFVLPSAIENSSNSLGEAMLLGVPSVASYVGGTPDLLADKKEGFLYPYDEPYMMANYVMNIFNDEKLALEISENAIKRAESLYDKEENCRILKSIYDDVIRTSSKK